MVCSLREPFSMASTDGQGSEDFEHSFSSPANSEPPALHTEKCEAKRKRKRKLISELGPEDALRARQMNRRAAKQHREMIKSKMASLQNTRITLEEQNQAIRSKIVETQQQVMNLRSRVFLRYRDFMMTPCVSQATTQPELMPEQPVPAVSLHALPYSAPHYALPHPVSSQPHVPQVLHLQFPFQMQPLPSPSLPPPLLQQLVYSTAAMPTLAGSVPLPAVQLQGPSLGLSAT